MWVNLHFEPPWIGISGLGRAELQEGELEGPQEGGWGDNSSWLLVPVAPRLTASVPVSDWALRGHCSTQEPVGVRGWWPEAPETGHLWGLGGVRDECTVGRPGQDCGAQDVSVGPEWREEEGSFSLCGGV